MAKMYRVEARSTDGTSYLEDSPYELFTDDPAEAMLTTKAIADALVTGYKADEAANPAAEWHEGTYYFAVAVPV